MAGSESDLRTLQESDVTDPRLLENLKQLLLHILSFLLLLPTQLQRLKYFL